ncbi:hypothetical protein D9M72_200070 [compost metagenome]
MTNPALNDFIRSTLHVSRLHLTREHREFIHCIEGTGDTCLFVEDMDDLRIDFPSQAFGGSWCMEVVKAANQDLTADARGWQDLAAVLKLARDNDCDWIEFEQAEDTEPLPASAGLAVYD